MRWAVGGIFLGTAIPLTLIAIAPTNKRLLDPALDRDSALAMRLLVRWGRLHALRTILSVVAFLLFLALKNRSAPETRSSPSQFSQQQGMEAEVGSSGRTGVRSSGRNIVSTSPYNRLDGGRTGPAAGDVVRGVVEIPLQPPDKVGEHNGR